jgi:hypothetical protein
VTVALDKRTKFIRIRARRFWRIADYRFADFGAKFISDAATYDCITVGRSRPVICYAGFTGR